MSVTLYITDGVTTVDLMNDFSPGVTDYTPALSIGAMSEDDADITENIGVYSKGTPVETVYTTIRTIETLLNQAKEYQRTKAQRRVYLVFAPSGAEYYRSEILKGKTQFTEDTLRINQAVQITDFSIMLSRRSYWELNSEEQLGLTNGSTAKTTSPVTIYNHNDAGSGHDHWVEIDGADIEGVLPASCRVELANTTGSNRDAIVYLGVATHNDADSFPSVLEGEDATGASTQVDANSSGGNFGRVTTTTSFTKLATWALSSANAIALAGRYYRIIARFANAAPASTQVYFSTHITGSTTEQTVSQIATLATTHRLQELGVLRLPPWLTSESGIQAFDIAFNAKSAVASNVDIDFIALFPTDSFKIITAVGNGAGNTDSIIIDDVDRWTYIQTSGGLKSSNLSVYGNPLMIWPGITQRLFCLVENNSSGGMDIDRTHTVRLYYRKRKASL